MHTPPKDESHHVHMETPPPTMQKGMLGTFTYGNGAANGGGSRVVEHLSDARSTDAALNSPDQGGLMASSSSPNL